MKKINLFLLISVNFYVAELHAASMQLNDINFNLEAGVSASAMYFDNPGFLRRHDSYILNDALVEISPSKDDTNYFKFYAGIGILQKQSINRIFAPIPPVDLGLQYGWLTVPTFKNRDIEIGHLVTNIGIESSISYKNPHALMGAIYSAQPNHYPGVRFNRTFSSFKSYIEVSNDPTIGDASAAIGIYKTSRGGRMSVSYYEAISERKMIDLVYSKSINSLRLGINLDYHALDEAAPNQDKNALGVALYMMHQNNKWKWPARVEYVNDGNTGIYQYDQGYTVTFSPSYNYNKLQSLRAEVIYAKSDGKPFRDVEGGFADSQWIATLQAVYELQ